MQINLSKLTALNRCKISRRKEGIMSHLSGARRASVEHCTYMQILVFLLKVMYLKILSQI